MTTITLIDANQKEFIFPIPETMNEMTVKQLTFLSALVEENMPIQEVKVKMLLYCMKARLKRKMFYQKDDYFRVKTKKGTFKMTTQNICEASSLFDFLFTEPDESGKCYLDNRLNVCPFPSIRIALFFKFYTPSDCLTNISYEQYIYLETYFERMQKEPEIAYAFLGTLLRPKEKSFNKKELHLRLMRFIPPKKVILLCWFFIGSIRFISEKFPRIFNGNGKQAKSSLFDSQQRLLDDIANNDPDKKVRIKEHDLYEVLYSLDRIIETAEKNPVKPPKR